ncbi:MAG: BsuBI/PstI family type II restriction endonuclease [Phycisphaeraceae bacterium]
MVKRNRVDSVAARKTKLHDAVDVLCTLGFGAQQSNEIAGYTFLALLDLRPSQKWNEAADPLRGITPIIKFIAKAYDIHYAPNTRETIRDEAVKYFVEAGMLIRNPDDPNRPTNSGKTVYQIESSALELFRSFGSSEWNGKLRSYLAARNRIRKRLLRERETARIPVKLPSGEAVTISPGGQNPLIKAVVEEFCPRFVPGATVAYVGDAEDKFLHLDAEYLKTLGVLIPAPAKMPDIIVHDMSRNWLLLIEAVMSDGPVDEKRRKELKELFSSCKAGLVFVTAFFTRQVMRSFLTRISWETEVWVAENPDHLIHFNGERFLGPYPDAMPKIS